MRLVEKLLSEGIFYIFKLIFCILRVKILRFARQATSFHTCTAITTFNTVSGFNPTGLNLSYSTLLTIGSMVSMFNNLATIGTTKTITLGTTNLAKLSVEQKAIATGKGWTLA